MEETAVSGCPESPNGIGKSRDVMQAGIGLALIGLLGAVLVAMLRFMNACLAFSKLPSRYRANDAAKQAE